MPHLQTASAQGRVRSPPPPSTACCFADTLQDSIRKIYQCDIARPSCARCLKANRSCSWESKHDTQVVFRSENAFAQGQRRRPKKQFIGGELPSLVAEVAGAQTSTISRPLSISLETCALHYWERNFTAAPDDVPDVAQEYLNFVLGDSGRCSPDSSLQQALSACTLATFGKMRHVNTALEVAERHYV